MLDALSPQRRRVVLVAGAAAVLAIVALAAVAVVPLLRSGATAAAPVRQDQPGPVLLLPGYGGDVGSLGPLAEALRATGRTVRVVEPADGGTGDLNAQAERLSRVAQEVRREAAAPSVDVVGCSAGGVVARLWVRDHGGLRIARRVLSVGSPQHGSRQAALARDFAGGCPPACEQLVPDSDLLLRLNAGDETPDGPAWVTVRTAHDEVVTPVGSATLAGALNILVQDVCPRSTTTHGGLPSDPVTLAALTSVLAPGPPRPPTHVRC